MTPESRWYVDVNGEIQVIDLNSLQELVRMGFVTGASEVSTDGVTFVRASEILPPGLFQKSAGAQSPQEASHSGRNEAYGASPRARQVVDEDAEWLHERFLPVFSPVATFLVLFLTGWFLWGFLAGVVYVAAFLFVVGLWLARGRFGTIQESSPGLPGSLPGSSPGIATPPPAPLSSSSPPMFSPPSQMPAFTPNRMRPVTEGGDGLGRWILLGVVLVILLAIAVYLEFR